MKRLRSLILLACVSAYTFAVPLAMADTTTVVGNPNDGAMPSNLNGESTNNQESGGGADNGAGIDCNFITGELQARCIPIFIGHLVVWIFEFLSVLFVLNIMYAGYQLAIGYSGGGDTGAGKERIKYSIIGLIICVCIFLIMDLVLNVLLG